MTIENNGTRSALRMALIGLGEGAERIMLPGLTTLPEVQLVAACDLDAGRRERVAGKWGIPAVYDDPQTMLEAVRPDAVAVATPPQTHYEMARLVLEQGCHLFCEKPFMPTLAAADEVLALARQRGLRVMVNNQYYQMPIFRRVQQAIDGGETGRLFHIHAWQQMAVPPETESGWKAALQPRRVLFEFGTHAIDLICRYFGDYPQAVTAQIARPRPESANDTCITARLDFPGYRVATLTLNRLSHAPIRYFEMRLDGEHLSLRTSLGGVARLDVGWNSERGRPRLRFSLTQGGEARAERDGRSRLLARQPASAFGTATAAHLAAFVAAVQGNREPEPSTAHARAVLATMLACYESAESGGRLVALAEAVTP